MNNPKISVLMPVYNAENFLKEAIDSILNQTFKDFEFFIINDASTDNSKKIIMSYNDKRIRHLENKKNLGVAGTLNRGLKLAEGKYIARMDADDIAYSQRLQIEYNEIIKDAKVAVVASFYDVIDENGKYLYTVKDSSSAEEIYYALQFRNCLGHPTVIFNKEIIINEFGGYDEKYEAEDYDLWLRLASRYKFRKIKKSLLKLRIHPKSRIGSFGNYINKSAFLLARNNLSSIINQPINIKTAKILTNYQENKPSSNEIKLAIQALRKINKWIIQCCPNFLDKLKITKVARRKEKDLMKKYIISLIF